MEILFLGMALDLKAMVYSAVKKDAMPIHYVAKACGLSVQTTSKYCHILLAEHKVELEKFGNMKMVRKK